MLFKLRTMPKQLAAIVAMGLVIAMFLVFCLFTIHGRFASLDDGYAGNKLHFLYGPDDEHRTIVDEPMFFESYAYKKQEEQEQIDVDEEVNANVDENVEEFEILSYKDSLKKTADSKGSVLIKYCEEGRVDSAINFHETSVVHNELNNVLYVTPDIRVCTELWKLEIKCHVMEEDFMMFNNSQIIENDRTVGKKRAIARIKLILKALTMGYTVLFTDLNTLYMRNPYDNIDCENNCDVALSVDNISMNFANWAIHLVKPRRSTVYMYARLLTIFGTMPIGSSKEVLNRVIGEMTNMKQIHVEYLSAEKFTPASFYFMVRRFEDEDTRCRTCVSVYEDRGISKENQIYQLKEVHLWHANFDEYYTSRRRNYIVYENVWDYGEKRSIVQELMALRNALAIGQALGRIVILPRFHCPESIFESKYCGLCDLLKMTDFDEEFGDLYREHTFLNHPKVSREVRRTVTDPYYIGKKLPTDVDWDMDSKIRPRHSLIFIAPEHPRGLKAEEFEEHFRLETSYNLRFHSLYEGFAGFEDTRTGTDFNRKIKRGFILTAPIREIVGEKSFEVLGLYDL